ncbi:MAG: hypothetical protein HYU84_18015 [Chloroflexi bacterium]|nr:hypothetical protein [Chloroflexota bacterium]MBI3168615.1 hypothetical protein [Chloroflexota bacterium]
MLARRPSTIQFAMALMGALMLLISFSMPITANADAGTPDNGKCISCHEDLYLLHDTGNWYCLNEAPMSCVGCHGGNPTSVVKEAAHMNRASHPIINEDVSKCQECHPEECDERVEIFRQRAGISTVFVAVPYTPLYSGETSMAPPRSGWQKEDKGGWLNALEFLPILIIISIALLTYTLYRFNHTLRGKK